MEGHNSPMDEKKSLQRNLPVLRKVYKTRNSFLTDMMEVNHIQTVYNICVSVFTILLINTVVFYVVAPTVLWKDLAGLHWASTGILFCIKAWLCLNLYAYSIYEGFKLWVRARNWMPSKLANFLFLNLYIISIMLMFTVLPYFVMQESLPPITGFAIVAEQIRLFMKVYSFVRENAPRVLRYNHSKDGYQGHALFPTRTQFTYFLFVPALIYRDSYPRTNEIRLQFIFRKLFQFFACIFIMYCIFMRFVVDVFRNTGVRKFTLPEASLVYVGSIVTGAMVMFCAFYGILHSWLNIFAEILRFGDREFYQDWWNSTSFSQYYRRWNGVVHDWLYAYVYAESFNLGLNRSVSLIGVFVISAMVHEYWIAFSLGFFYPVLMIIYTTIGLIVLFLTKQRTANFWNTFMWIMLFSGWGFVVSLYALEWFARINCPRQKDFYADFFSPRSWEPTCQIFQFS